MAWQLDKQHSEIGFAVRHMMISTVKGKFRSFDLEAEIDPSDLAHAKVSASIDASSIDTGEPDRDGHLKSGDFLDVETHPRITFKSTSISKKDAEHYQVKGALTIRDVTRDATVDVEVAGPAKDPWGKERMGFTVRGEIDREQWGLKWNQVLEAGGVLVGKAVHLHADIELIGS
jgi:polyisoprenoid-binding protein YceI